MALGLGLLTELLSLFWRQLIIILVILVALKFIPETAFIIIQDWSTCGLTDCMIWNELGKMVNGIIGVI